eukprot:4768801-Amphidinium_carterae.1
MEEILHEVRVSSPRPAQLLADEDLDLLLPWLIIKRLKRVFMQLSHYDGLENNAPTPIDSSPIPARPVGVTRFRSRDPLDLAQLPGDDIYQPAKSAFQHIDWYAELPPGKVSNPEALARMSR